MGKIIRDAYTYLEYHFDKTNVIKTKSETPQEIEGFLPFLKNN
jgi:hypothetical protein